MFPAAEPPADELGAAGCFDSRLMLFPFPGAMTLDPPPPHPSNPFQADLRSLDDAGSGVEEWWMAAPRPAGLALCMPVRNPIKCETSTPASPQSLRLSRLHTGALHTATHEDLRDAHK